MLESVGDVDERRLLREEILSNAEILCNTSSSTGHIGQDSTVKNSQASNSGSGIQVPIQALIDGVSVEVCKVVVVVVVILGKQVQKPPMLKKVAGTMAVCRRRPVAEAARKACRCGRSWRTMRTLLPLVQVKGAAASPTSAERPVRAKEEERGEDGRLVIGPDKVAEERGDEDGEDEVGDFIGRLGEWMDRTV